MYRPVKCYLWIYLSKQNDLSSTFHVLKSCLLWCCGLSPPRTCWTEYSGNTSLGSVWTHLLELISHQLLLPACRHLLQFLRRRSVWTRPNQLLESTEMEFFFPEVRHNMKFILSHPSFSLKKEGKCVTTETLGPILSSSAFPQVAPVTCHYIKYCSACTGMTESDPSCLWLLVIQESLGWGVGNKWLM